MLTSLVWLVSINWLGGTLRFGCGYERGCIYIKRLVSPSYQSVCVHLLVQLGGPRFSFPAVFHSRGILRGRPVLSARHLRSVGAGLRAYSPRESFACRACFGFTAPVCIVGTPCPLHRMLAGLPDKAV